MASGLTVQRSNPGKDGIFTHVQTGSGVHRASCTTVIRLFPRAEWPWCEVDHSSTTSAEVKDRVDTLYLHDR
jgi:hypothetical protein